jgi:hypothetical protein
MAVIASLVVGEQLQRWRLPVITGHLLDTTTRGPQAQLINPLETFLWLVSALHTPRQKSGALSMHCGSWWDVPVANLS